MTHLEIVEKINKYVENYMAWFVGPFASCQYSRRADSIKADLLAHGIDINTKRYLPIVEAAIEKNAKWAKGLMELKVKLISTKEEE